MNIFRKKIFSFKSLVKIELSYVFIINMSSTAETAWESELSYIPDKKRNAPLRFSPLRSPFNAKMLIVMKYSFLIKS